MVVKFNYLSEKNMWSKFHTDFAIKHKMLHCWSFAILNEPVEMTNDRRMKQICQKICGRRRRGDCRREPTYSRMAVTTQDVHAARFQFMRIYFKILINFYLKMIVILERFNLWRVLKIIYCFSKSQVSTFWNTLLSNCPFVLSFSNKHSKLTNDM